MSASKRHTKRTKSDAVMDYGTYRGRLLSTLPAKYIHHLWTNGHLCEKFKGKPEGFDKAGSIVYLYVTANKFQLNREFPSKEW